MKLNIQYKKYISYFSTFGVLMSMFLLSVIGFTDSLYLTLTHNSGLIACSILEGCDVVLTSKYAQFMGLPTALLGMVFYGFVMAVLLSIMLIKNNTSINPQCKNLFLSRMIRFLPFLTLCGVGASAYFVYIQGFVLHAWCQYCVLSAFTSTLIFILSLLIRVMFEHEKQGVST